MQRNFSGVVFPTDTIRITLPFAATYPAQFYSLSNPHKGLDASPFPGAFGEPVRAPFSGKVVKAVKQTWGMGNYVVIETSFAWPWGAHDVRRLYKQVPANQTFWIILGHLRSFNVSKGQAVSAGQQVGQIGSVGVSSGAHVHIELRVGDYNQRTVLNPEEFFTAHIVGYRDARFYSSPADEQFAREWTYGKAA